MAELLTGADGFYDEIFASLGLRHTPARWAQDDWTGPDEEKWAEKQVAVSRLITSPNTPLRKGVSGCA